MPKIGESVDPSELEDEPSSASSNPPQDKIKTAWEYIKGMGREGINELEAGMTGAAGPFTAIPSGILALEMKAAHGGDLSDRFKQAQQTYAKNLSKYPISGMLGAALSPASKLPGGVSSLALQGAAQSSGLGSSALGGAAIGGGIGLLGKGVGAVINKAANSETLSPLINRLKFLKPTPEEAQPLSESGQSIRDAISDTSAQGIWQGLPSRQGMLERLKGAQGQPAKRIGDILSHADQVNVGSSSPEAMIPQGIGGGNRVRPDLTFPSAKVTLKDLLSHSSSSGANPERLANIAQQEGQNAIDASGSLSALNKAKQSIYNQTYTPNSPDMAENFLPGRDQLLRSMGRDVKNSIQGSLDNLHNIDPSVDAEGFSGANKQYGMLADLIGPLNRATGKEIAGSGNAHLYGGPTHIGFSMLGDMLNFGGRRQLAQAHAGEFLQGADRALTSYKPAQAVARAFVSGNTPGINQEEDEPSQ